VVFHRVAAGAVVGQRLGGGWRNVGARRAMVPAVGSRLLGLSQATKEEQEG